MKTFAEIKEIALKTIAIEAEAISDLKHLVNDEFSQVVTTISESKGRLVFTGIGKSANIANKIVATMNSTGTPSLFMHAADAIHGDLGSIQKEDIVVCISKSGNTPEIKTLIPRIDNNKIIAMTGNPNSYLGKHANYIINCSVKEEACPNNLAPTSSTTAQLVMGDALAICLLDYKGFSSADFAKFHPGGSLGKQLLTKVKDLVQADLKPQIRSNAPVKEVILEISSNRMGAVAVLGSGKVLGLITDGDIRRMLEKHNDISSLMAKDIMSKNPKTVELDELAVKTVDLFKNHNISQLMVLNEGKYYGLLHFHDLLREGIV